MSKIAERIFPWLTALIALFFAWVGFDELQYDPASRPHQLPSLLTAFAISALFGITSAACWLRLRFRRLATLVCGGCLLVFTISALRESYWDDASGILNAGIVAYAGITAALALILGLKGFAKTADSSGGKVAD